MDSILFSGIDPQEFKRELLAGVKKELQEFTKKSQEQEVSELLTRQEVAKLLSIDLSTLHTWTKKGKLISYGIGHRVYYKRREIEQAIIKL